ncbi:SUMF1/EgtB/PvdO family nonheme iron enzyme [Pseudoalteromonas sp. APC 3218]|uniref:SUMF1/EgtB/PvdO family nonheme iron enzyme n=1 Tax=Pseudoalteromonas sp. APC 3218 TaxID=3035180 RepID=UPI0025B356A8|nr:SUMF1/EgtB/PvdO family nonheme iron enzyme [Pseudoalteromonas sp. APC 3218]MDN3403758.1 SUMF1/EgtB/PvdO family nonheme iron enzyme [Pseudoalteromonas sp. APC 3218]
MATYTAKQVSINNGSRDVVINSGELPQNINVGDFLCIGQFAPMEINRVYFNDNNTPFIELVELWKNDNQASQPAIVIPTTVEFRETAHALKAANTLVNDNTQAMQAWQTKLGEVEFKNIDGTKTLVKTLKQMELDYQSTVDGTSTNVQAMLDWQTKLGEVTFTNLDGTTTTVKTVKQLELEANNALVGAVESNNEAITNALNTTMAAKAELDSAIEVATTTMATSSTLNQNMMQAQADIDTAIEQTNTATASLNSTIENAIDNTQAMHDWQTQLGEVDFLNADGTTTTLKTIKQMELESAQALATSIDEAMVAITQRDREAYTKTIEAASAGRNSVFWDNQGNPNVMVWINKFNCEDINQVILDKWGVDCQLGTGTHPAFIKQGQEMRGFWYGKYQASESLAGGCSVVEGATPLVNINFDDAKALCQSKGENWHMASNSEWAAVAYLSLAHGQTLRGNTDRGRAHDAKNESGRRVDNLAPGDSSSAGFTGTGTGPNTWSHDGTAFGVFDLVGNVWEWVDQLKMQDGQIICPDENNDEISEYAWQRHDVYYDVDNPTDRNITLNNELVNILGDVGQNHNLGFSAISPFNAVLKSPSYTGNELMRQLALECPTDLLALTGKLFTRNFGERLPFRGGAFFMGESAGLAAMNLHYNRTSELSSVGFRPALFENESDYKLLQKPRYFSRTDGQAQYYNLSKPVEIPANTDFKVSFYVQGFNDAYEGLFENSQGTSTWLRLLPRSQSQNLQGYDEQNYFGFLPQQTIWLRDGEVRKVTLIREQGKLYAQINDSELIYSRAATAAWTFDRLCKFSSTYFGGLFYDFEVEIAGEVVLQLPLTNKEQGAVQLPTVGDITATMANYTPLVWEREGTKAIHYAVPDGETQAWVLDTPINLLANDILELSFIGGQTSNSTEYFLGDESYKFACFSTAEGSVFGGYGNIPTLNGQDVSYVDKDTPIPLGGHHKIQLKISREAILEYIGARNLESGLSHLAMYGFRHLRDGVLLSEIPLTNRSQGATQKPTVGNITATMANFTPLIWKNQEEL